MAVVRKLPKKVAVIVAEKDSVIPDIKELTAFVLQKSSTALETVGFFIFTAISPSEFAGKKVMVFHGGTGNHIPERTQNALALYNQDIEAIFCCYPKQMRRTLSDNRVQWAQIDRPLYVKMQEIGNKLIFTIKEGD